MGVWLADVAAPSSFDITEARQGVLDVVGSDRAEVDLNHIYTAGTTISSTHPGIPPRSALAFPDDTRDLPLRVGMIDSSVDLTHPSLAKSWVESRSFVSPSARQPNFHGTAIASIIVANNDEYVGLAPNAELFAASVFEDDPGQGEIASTLSLIRALDWLISSNVDVVNISLAGPPNRLLESALKRVTDRGILVVAAAGNGGPGAKPMYPAAYDDVVAVTAVDSRSRVFRLANRGAYLDLAAPGVDLLHARAGGGYASSSGTSFAVPFAATAAARLLKLHPEEDTLAELYATAQDLGPLGRDDIYGYGLLRFTSP
jgi:subtilisin family serine protease